MIEKRFKLDCEVGFIDTQKCGGDTMTHFEVIVKLNKLNEENEQLTKELKVYRKLARCSNCEHHGYDWFSDGEEFEVCEKGNDVTERICEDWEEL